MDELPEMLPRRLHRDLTLVQAGACRAAIVYPHQDPAAGALARRLAAAIGRWAADLTETIPDAEILPGRGVPLPQATRGRTLILLGNLNTNRLVLPLYARYYCATDALYPGGAGYDLRTLVNPYGTGANWLLAGASAAGGLEKAAARLEALIAAAGRPGELSLPYLMEVELETGLAKMLTEWPDARLDAEPPTTADLPMYRAIGAYALAYNWTGDPRYGVYARDCLRHLNGLMDEGYGDRHYYLERLLRAVLILSAGGFLEPADLLRTDNLLLHTAIGQQDMWWRKRDASPPLGHRHHGKGTYEFYLIASYLGSQANPNPAGRRLCQRWISESQAFLDGLAAAGFDDQDDDTTMNNLATLPWYALGEERFDFFENGNARLLAERGIALHDNMGASAGQSGYTEAYLNMLYMQQEATIPVAAAAFYYGDPALKWILRKLPNLDVPIAGGRNFYYYPIFMHKFDTDGELSPEPPAAQAGMRVLKLAPYQWSLNNAPPLHVEPHGHLVNAPETWLLPEGVDLNRLAFERCFDKIVARPGFERDDPYLLLQGYQGGFRWQGRNRGAGCIVRFSQYGHIFLVQNTRHLSPYHLNGVYVSDGTNSGPVPPMAEWLGVDDFETTGLASTRLAPYHGAAWTRHVFWRKPGAGFFVVIDCLAPEAAGEFSFTCTWRTLAYASRQGRSWTSDQGAHRFTLRCSEDLQTFTEIEDGQSAAAPYLLRQVKHASAYPAGEPVGFQNLFYARPLADFQELDLRQQSQTECLVVQDGVLALGVCAVNPIGGEMTAVGIRTDAVSAWIGADEISLSGAKNLSIEAANWSFESTIPVGISLDLTACRAIFQCDSPGVGTGAAAQVSASLDGRPVSLGIQPGEQAVWALSEQGCRSLAASLVARLEGLRAGTPPADATGRVKPERFAGLKGWHIPWGFSGWSPAAERLRALTVAAEPAPIDGFPEQLIDTVYPELRDSRQQWPEAEKYIITLTLAEKRKIDTLRLVGDSRPEPFFKVFNPLPDGVRIELSEAAAGEDWRDCTTTGVPGEAIQQRFRGIEDRLEAPTFAIGQAARRVRLSVPAPPPGQPLVLNEVELFAPPLAASTKVKYMAACGSHFLAAINAADELVVLSLDGQERWRQQLSSPATALACHNLDGSASDEADSICVGQLDGDVLIFSPQGRLRQAIHLREEMARRTDAFFGWMDCPNAIQVWQRDEAGRAALMVGGYGVVVFLDPQGQIAGHSFADGSWVYSLLALPSTKGADIYARTGWNHGLMVYEGRAGFAPSGETITFGGVRQPMFRPLRQVIPFVNGRTLLFEAAASASGTAPDLIVAAAEDGLGVLSTASREWQWKIEGGTPLAACRVAPGEVVSGGSDGFVSAFSLEEGRPLRTFYAGAPVTGLAALGAEGGLAVATLSGVLALDPDWKVSAFSPIEAVGMCPVGSKGIAVAVKNGKVVYLEI